jgi:transketolase
MTDRDPFACSELTADEIADLEEQARAARGTILTMTSAAGSGHPGGSFSSLEALLVTYRGARIRPDDPRWPGRDRVVVSHGHVSPGVYAALAARGFFPAAEVEAHFRQAGSVFEGHVERSVPGVEWGTGNLGQGLSVGAGFALAARMRQESSRVFVVMSDGEQNKGQVAEARRLTSAQGLTELTAIVDLNGIQISGHTEDVMPVHVAETWAADGWAVAVVDGHDVAALHRAIAAVADRTRPHVVLARTVIGKGVSFMEDQPAFHGRALTRDEYAAAMAELGLEPRLDVALAARALPCAVAALDVAAPAGASDVGTPRTYTPGERVDARSAWGRALVDIADAVDSPVAVFDCDLAVSVKTEGFSKEHPDGFVQCGVGEHDAAAAAGACASTGVPTFLSDFGVFGIDEVYNQQRLNDINHAGLSLCVTHCGLDVGEDGKTHQCLDYVGALRDFFGWRVIVPADANQVDRAVRFAAATPGNVAVAMGRSKLPIIVDGSGDPVFTGDHAEALKLHRIREGAEALVLVMGTPSAAAVEAVDRLRAAGADVGLGIVALPLELEDDIAWIAAHPLIVTVEDHAIASGLGCSVALGLADIGSGARLVRHGVAAYQSSGAASDLYAAARLDADGIEAVVAQALASVPDA